MPTASLASSSAAVLDDPYKLPTLQPVHDPLAEALTNRIEAIRALYRLETGRDLSLSAAIRKLADTKLPGDFPERRDAVKVRKFLASKGYTATAIDGAISDIRRCGTAQCTPYLDEADRAEVEAILSPSPDWNSPKWDGITIGWTGKEID